MLMSIDNKFRFIALITITDKNKKMKHYIFFLVALVTFSSCVTVQNVQLVSTAGEPEIFISKKPDKPYTEVSFVEASGSIFHSNKKLLKKLKEKATKDRVDAVVDVKFGYVFWLPYVTGILIQYNK